MEDNRTTAAVQEYLNDLADAQNSSAAEPIVRALLGRAVTRLQLLCGTMLHRSYPRLVRPPLNLDSDELLSSVVERLLKAMREIRPQSVRQFFALANKHMRWELNDLARRLDERTPPVELRESFAPAAADESAGEPGPKIQHMLNAVENLPEDERETLGLVRVQGMTHAEAAQILGVSPKTIERRLNRSLVLLTNELRRIQGPAPGTDPAHNGV